MLHLNRKRRLQNRLIVCFKKKKNLFDEILETELKQKFTRRKDMTFFHRQLVTQNWILSRLVAALNERAYINNGLPLSG